MNLKSVAVLIFAVAFIDTAHAQSGGMKGMDATAHEATGMVTKVDAAKGKVTIRHDPVQSLNWPSMTMAFTVKDKKLLDKLAVDNKVGFEFVQRGREYVVTSVK
jgi:Cu(I)/Ag(I) efflux system protein CusF